MTTHHPTQRVTNAAALLALTCALTTSTRAAAQQRPRAFAITHVTLISGTGTTPTPDVTVLVVKNRIAELGPSDGITIPADATIIDGRGKFLIPGLWDMHVHLGDATSAALPMFMAAGVTGVRDMGSPRF